MATNTRSLQASKFWGKGSESEEESEEEEVTSSSASGSESESEDESEESGSSDSDASDKPKKAGASRCVPLCDQDVRFWWVMSKLGSAGRGAERRGGS